MKLALLMDGSRSQVSLTPETSQEKAILSVFVEGGEFRVKIGTTLSCCRGGWIREHENDRDSVNLVSVIPRTETAP